MAGGEMTWIGGIEALHSFTPPGASEPAITLGQGAYRITGIQGLSSLGESEANSDARVGGVGEVARLSQRRGRTVAYEGRIIASSLLELRNAEFELREAFDDDSGEGRMEIAAHPDNAELAGEPPKYYEARALSCDISDQQTSKSFTRSFVIGLRMGTPRVYDVDETSDELAIAKTKTANSMALILPKRYLGPILTLSLPKYTVAVNLVITNVTTGKTMTVEVPVLAAALEVTFDFATKTVTDSNGVNRSAWVSATDDALWVVNPLIEGSNDVEVEAFEAAEGENLSTARKFPRTAASDASFGTVAWTVFEELGEGSIVGETTLSASNTQSQYLKMTNFGFEGIPAGATADGIEFSVEEIGIPLGAKDARIRAVKGGAIQATDRSIAGKWAGVSRVARYGGPMDTFGAAWAGSDLTSSGFGLAIAVERAELSPSVAIKAVSAAVFYSYLPAATAYGATARVRWRRAYA
jgi:hypothetical protein